MESEFKNITFNEILEEAEFMGNSQALSTQTPFCNNSGRFEDLTRFIQTEYGHHSEEMDLINSAYLRGFNNEKLSTIHDCFTSILEYFAENKDHLYVLPFSKSDVYKALRENNEEFLFDWMAMIYLVEPGIDSYHYKESVIPYIQVNETYNLV